MEYTETSRALISYVPLQIGTTLKGEHSLPEAAFFSFK